MKKKARELAELIQEPTPQQNLSNSFCDNYEREVQWRMHGYSGNKIGLPIDRTIALSCFTRMYEEIKAELLASIRNGQEQATAETDV